MFEHFQADATSFVTIPKIEKKYRCGIHIIYLCSKNSFKYVF